MDTKWKMEIPSFVQGLSLEVGKGPKESTRLKPRRKLSFPPPIQRFQSPKRWRFQSPNRSSTGHLGGDFFGWKTAEKTTRGKRGCPEKTRGEKTVVADWKRCIDLQKHGGWKETQNKSWMRLWRRVNTEEVSRLGNRWQHHLSKERMSLCLYIFRGYFHSLQGWECHWISVWSGFLLKVFFGGFVGNAQGWMLHLLFFSHQNSRQNVFFFHHLIHLASSKLLAFRPNGLRFRALCSCTNQIIDHLDFFPRKPFIHPGRWEDL